MKILIGAITLLIVVCGGYYFSTHIKMSASKVNALSVVVSSSAIDIDVTFDQSYICYTNHRVKYEDGRLYVLVLGSMVCKLPPEITIPNTYGDIEAIYLQGSDPSDQKLIWSKQDQAE